MCGAGHRAWGRCPHLGSSKRAATSPSKTLEDVLKAAKWSKPVLRQGMKPCATPGVDEEVWMRTEDEVGEGKAAGPYTEAEVDGILGRLWAPARRGGLPQPAGVNRRLLGVRAQRHLLDP